MMRKDCFMLKKCLQQHLHLVSIYLPTLLQFVLLAFSPLLFSAMPQINHLMTRTHSYLMAQPKKDRLLAYHLPQIEIHQVVIALIDLD